MKSIVWTLSFIFAMGLVSNASACGRSMPAGAERAVVPTQAINQRLVDAAIRAEVNWHRCRVGLPSLAAAGSRLVQVAAGHSQWMARARNLSHRSNVRGASSLPQRLNQTGIQMRRGTENISMVHRYAIDNRRFQVVDSNTCRFATMQGQTLPAHSYASLARHAVDLWMRSPGHRRNILDRRVTHVATAAVYGPAQHCGQFWLTQNFVG